MRQGVRIVVYMVCSLSMVYASNTRVTTVAGFNAALSIANPGDTITLANQTWQNAVFNFSGRNGTAALPIVLRAETFGSVVITDNSNLRIGGDYLVVDGLVFRNAVSASNNLLEYRSNSGIYANHSRLTNSAFVNCNPPNSSTEYGWVKMYGTVNRMDHCYFSGKNHQGPTFQIARDRPDPNYAHVDSNYFAYRPDLGINGQETVKIGSGPNSLFNSNSVVEYNLFERCNGEVETISNKSCENVIRYNTFVNNEGTITLRQGHRCQVYGNFFFGNGTSATGGIRVHGYDHKIYNNYFSGLRGDDTRSALSIENGHVVTDTTTEAQYFPVRRLLVVFNTFVNNAYNINIGIAGDPLSVVPPDSMTFANNVIRGIDGVTQSPLILQVDTATHTTWSSNIFYGASLGISPVPAGFTNTDPSLSLQPDGFYRPAANSPLINAAQSGYPFVPTDMDGQPRDALPDIGADEYSGASIRIRPVTSSDVGPRNLQVILGVKPDRDVPAPDHFALEQNYPNPFNPSTIIRYRVSVTSKVHLSIFDCLGRVVDVLVDKTQAGGHYQVEWNAAQYPSGVYFCRIQAGPIADSKKMILVK